MARNSDRDDPAGWTRFWDEAQRQAWAGWVRAAGTSAATGPDAVWSAWNEGLEQLWRGEESALGGTGREVFSRLIEQSRGFFFLSHQLLQAVERMEAQAEGGADWQAVLREAVDRAQEQLRQWAGISTGQAALWGLPAAMWERLASVLAMTPGEWLRTLRGVAGEEAGGASTPPWPGPGGEWSQQAQEGARLAAAAEEAWRRYAARLVDVGVRGLDLLYERLVAAGEQGRRIRSLRELYDLWVDAAEEAWAEIVATPDFARLQAAVVNRAVAVKRHLQKGADQAARALNLPSRGELDEAHRALHEMRLELERLRGEIADRDDDADDEERGPR